MLILFEKKKSYISTLQRTKKHYIYTFLNIFHQATLVTHLRFKINKIYYHNFSFPKHKKSYFSIFSTKYFFACSFGVLQGIYLQVYRDSKHLIIIVYQYDYKEGLKNNQIKVIYIYIYKSKPSDSNKKVNFVSFRGYQKLHSNA